MTSSLKTITSILLSGSIASAAWGAVPVSQTVMNDNLRALAVASGATFAAGKYQRRLGGVIFYIDDIDGDGYALVADIADQSMTFPAQVTGTTNLLATRGNGLYRGIENTEATYAALGAGTGAAACTESRAGGQTDWYLGSPAELGLMAEYQIAINQASLAAGGGNFANLGAPPISTNAVYLSSTQYSADLIWTYDFDLNQMAPASKNARYYVRCIRRAPLSEVSIKGQCGDAGSICY